jgi:hypothetical protein
VAPVHLREASVSDSLVDLLDSLVDTGVAAGGDVTLSVAGVDLVELHLNAVLASIGTEGAGDLAFPSRRRERARVRPARIDADPDSLQRGLAQLVLVVVELLAELMERQAVRRMAAGTLEDRQVRALSATFVALHDRIDELTEEIAQPPSLGKRRLEPTTPSGML